MLKHQLFSFSLLLTPLVYFAQQTELRENIKLKSFNYDIYLQNKKDQSAAKELYVIPNKGDTIKGNALVKNASSEEIHRGFYRINDSEIHFIDIDLTSNKISQRIYSPNKKGSLKLIRENLNLSAYPNDLPPKFKDNKPPHPKFEGSEAALYQWIEKNINPVLDQIYKKKDNGNAVLVLDIDSKGSASFVEIRNLSIADNIKTKLIEVVKKSPAWKSHVNGFDVSGAVFIPIEY
ncbi:hypothetical protein B0A69_20130 [Chryseobacterium shigense]|uniref:Uncharacterized protein n=1 Tax=Chryseobacterium shigense TaxID=297244 RepID=A0A1N7I1D0_9FLAO|nr:hypothetical protein [Chryseobacterium shigense]PQA90637.1 hypothetical protein B0A69_20130 [Chryseobacterium shigense]SIS30866.1 hypothetical protein SAMN05421639_1011043 [Chryseobacterium shigense]